MCVFTFSVQFQAYQEWLFTHFSGLGSIDRNGNDATHTKWIIKDKLSNKYEKNPQKCLSFQFK